MAEKSESEIDDIASRVMQRLKIGGGGTTIGGGNNDMCGAAFRCGAFECSGVHQCPNTFECNIRFSGVTSPVQAK
jgi:hypothetical protein